MTLPAASPLTAAAGPSAAPPLVGITLAAGLLLLAWDASGLDLTLARLAGQPAGFPARDHWLLTDVLHQGGRALAWLLAGVQLALVRWPLGPWRALSPLQRWQLALATLLAVLAVSLLKAVSQTSCPWSLQDFGGAVPHVSHWAWGVADGGGGRCFPAGHASAGFSFVGGYLVFRRTAPALARAWLAAALVSGLVLGLGQQWRGAHFMSHTLWTAWVCWCVAWALDHAVARRLARGAA